MRGAQNFSSNELSKFIHSKQLLVKMIKLLKVHQNKQYDLSALGKAKQKLWEAGFYAYQQARLELKLLFIKYGNRKLNLKEHRDLLDDLFTFHDAMQCAYDVLNGTLSIEKKCRELTPMAKTPKINRPTQKKNKFFSYYLSETQILINILRKHAEDVKGHPNFSKKMGGALLVLAGIASFILINFFTAGAAFLLSTGLSGGIFASGILLFSSGCQRGHSKSLSKLSDAGEKVEKLNRSPC